jgi:hypothetical protein
MVVVGLGSTGLGWGTYACAGLRYIGLVCGIISGVVGVVGVVPYVFAVARRSSAASRYIGISGYAGHNEGLRAERAMLDFSPGMEIG